MNEPVTTTGGALVPAQPAKAIVSIGDRGLRPTDMDGLWRTAQAVSKSGLAPKGLESPEAVFVAMEMGLELGLPLMASLQNIAVVNGRPTLWGDSQLAVVRATGELEEFSEWYEVAGKRVPRNPSAFDDTTAAVCRVKRRGLEASETAFSVADAKRAGLWGKQGPWSQYPARMLRFRARSFGLRDQFGDALRGLLSTEEAGDIPVEVAPTAPARTLTPRFKRPEPTAAAPHMAVEATPEAAPTTPPPSVGDDGDLGPAAPVEAQEHRDLFAVITGAGATFDGFLAWAIADGQPGAADWTGIADVPVELAGRLAKAGKGLAAALKGGAR